MDNIDNNTPQFSSEENEMGTGDENQLEELSHSDKMIGVFTDPVETFKSTSKFPPKTVDWVLPVILLLVFSIISQFILFSNPEISYQVEQKQKEAIDKMVDSGDMSREQADQVIEQQKQFTSGTTGGIIRSVSTLIFGFIVFLIISGIYFLFSRFALKGEGNYSSALVATGLSAYISIVQIIVITILGVMMGRMLQDVSVASLMNLERSSFSGWILSFIDVIGIWGYVILSIGLAKMFHSENMKKYFVLVFGLWVAWKLIMYAIGDAVPWLSGM